MVESGIFQEHAQKDPKKLTLPDETREPKSDPSGLEGVKGLERLEDQWKEWEKFTGKARPPEIPKYP